MDDFTPYGDDFMEVIVNLESVLKIYIEINILLSKEKFQLMMDEGVVLWHYVSTKGIPLDPSKIQVIINLT